MSRHRAHHTPGHVLVVWCLAGLGLAVSAAMCGALGLAEEIGEAIRLIGGW